jgi:hypothetical protein
MNLNCQFDALAAISGDRTLGGRQSPYGRGGGKKNQKLKLPGLLRYK